MSPLVALLAAAAGGACLLTVATVVSADPRRLGNHAYAVFSLCLTAMFVGFAGVAVTPDDPTSTAILRLGAHTAPVAYTAFALLQVQRARWIPVALGLAIVLAAFSLGSSPWMLTGGDALYQVVFWIWGAVLLRRHGGSGSWRQTATIVLVAGVIVPFVTYGLWRSDYVLVAAITSIVTIAAQKLVLASAFRRETSLLASQADRIAGVAASIADESRLALVGTVATTIAHEVRNPLAGIRSLAQQMSADLPAPRRREYADVIVREVDRLDALVGTLNAAARRPGPQHAALHAPLASVMDDVELLVRERSQRRGVRVRTAVAVEETAPRDALTQLLLNLVVNAIDHAPSGSDVTVIAERATDGTRLVVHDDGPGIPADLRARVFQPFVSGRGGTGLGLAVVHDIATQQGWRVTLADDGQGTTFHVSFSAQHP